MVKNKFEVPCPCGSGKKYKNCCLPKKRQLLEETGKRLPELIDRFLEYFFQEKPELFSLHMESLTENAPWLEVDSQQMNALLETCPYLKGSLLDWLCHRESQVSLNEAFQLHTLLYDQRTEDSILAMFSQEAQEEDLFLIEALQNLRFSFYRVTGCEEILELHDLFADEELKLHHAPWELKVGDYAFIGSFQLACGAENIDLAFRMLAKLPAEAGQQIEGLLRQLYAEFGAGTSQEDFLKNSFEEIYWLIAGYLPLEKCYEYSRKRIEITKLGHGSLAYEFSGQIKTLAAFLQSSCQGQDEDENWLQTVQMPFSSQLLFFLGADRLFVDYFHQDAKEEVEKLLAPVAGMLKTVDAKWETLPEMMANLPAELWRDLDLPVLRELFANLIQQDLYQCHLDLAAEKLDFPIQGVDTLRDLAADPPSRFFLSLYLDRLEGAFQQFMPPAFRFDFDSLREELGAAKELLDWPTYANVLQRATKWLQQEGYSWKEQSSAESIWRTFAPRALPELEAPGAWAAALAAMSCSSSGKDLIRKLSRAFGASQKEIRHNHKTMLICYSLLHNYHNLFPDAEAEVPSPNDWELALAAEYSPVVEKAQQLIDDDHSLKYMLGTILAQIMEEEAENQPKIAMMSFFYALGVHGYPELGSTILKCLEPALIPMLSSQEEELYRELLSLTLQIMVCQGEEEMVFCNPESGEAVPLPGGLEVEDGDLALNLVFTREGQPCILSSLVVPAEKQAEFTTFAQQTYWNWRKENSKGEFEAFIQVQGHLLLAWLAH